MILRNHPSANPIHPPPDLAAAPSSPDRMKHLAAIITVVATLSASASAQVRRPGSSNSEDGIYSRTIIHPDETRTVSKQDTNNNMREKRTLDKNGILLMKSLFKLNAAGQAINGLVYDGRNRLLYRSEFVYDRANQLEEERVFDARGTLVRRLFYKKDRLGRLKPVSQTVFENGTQRNTSSGNLEDFSTSSPHAYRSSGSGGVASTPSAYRRPAQPDTRTRTTPSKRERRFKIFRSRR